MEPKDPEAVKIPTDELRLVQQMERDEENKLVTRISIELSLPADFPEKYRDAVRRAAEKCAVKRHLAEAPQVTVKLKE